MRKYFFCVITMFLFAVGTAQGQRLLPEDEKILNDLIDYDGNDEEEIGNFDFLYTNGGDNLNYDEVMTENLIDEALSHIGARYVYGSKGPNTFDCSGFTSYVYRQQNKINIGASSREQYATNIPIKRSEMQAGDLVFFTSPRSGRGVGHVGIVLSFDPVTDTFTFIHASTTKGVRISKSTEGYYQKRYIGVRRVK